MVENKDEIHGDMGKAALELQKDSTYAAMFRKAFPGIKEKVDQGMIQIVMAL